MVKLYNGDCIEFMKILSDKSIDAIVTDPPYGINFMNGGGRSPKHNWRTFYDNEGDWDKRRPAKEYFDEILRIANVAIIWGGNYFTDYLPPSQRWLVWDKGQRNFDLADGELAWCSQNKAMRIFTFHRGIMNKERVEHPTQKPIALMKWCIELVNAQTIFDPFMGSGTTGVACVQLERDFIGCEVNKKYFELAEKRIKQAESQQNLFKPVVYPDSYQGSLFEGMESAAEQRFAPDLERRAGTLVAEN